jgi:hypothetical protein
VERCVERVSRLYERGVDLVRIGAYVRCWQNWARSALRELGQGLSVRALDRVSRFLVRALVSLGPLPTLFAASAGTTKCYACDDSARRHP